MAADFGRSPEQRDRSLIEDSCDQKLRNEQFFPENGGLSLLMRTSRQSSLMADVIKDEALSSIKEPSQAPEHNLILPQDDQGSDFDNVPPTFRGQPDRPNQYFALTEDPAIDRKQEHPGGVVTNERLDQQLAVLESQLSNPMRQSEANIFSKPMNPYTVLEAKLDEMKEDEELLFQFKTGSQGP